MLNTLLMKQKYKQHKIDQIVQEVFTIDELILIQVVVVMRRWHLMDLALQHD